ncbi:PREDICTED: uncharacterized protein LOC108558909 isoform X2 [Nicrophorus vespilloides]|uniref:Uncharacterized protein LOC108558909 isoform X2 n=1 Tax=Nicrophorus vespilloides TaxID=110193 RepID=A0ABM1MA57_NICVS|nr:PREDICTED: uncharacterized protein LOC108558909 isoform X2 [Nicrophorus vespilloides]
MALVAYGSDSESDNYSDHDEDKPGTVTLLQKSSSNEAQSSDKIEEGPDTLFKKLPDPKMDTNPDIEEEVDEFLMKKEVALEKPQKLKKIIKIGVPALEQFDSDEEDAKPLKLRLQASKASGLFAILPAPKNVPMTNRTFVPNVLTKKKKPTATITRPKQETKPKVAEKRKLPQESDDEDDDESKVETFDDETWKQVCGKKKKPVKIIPDAEEDATPDTTVDSAPDAQEPYGGLDNEAFKQLVGSGKLHKENIKLVDINEAEVLTEKDAWVTKALTDPEANPKGTAINDPVNNTCKKKHHITYLAQQAKANEQELQNQWSASRFSRKQTQAKYGF